MEEDPGGGQNRHGVFLSLQAAGWARDAENRQKLIVYLNTYHGELEIY